MQSRILSSLRGDILDDIKEAGGSYLTGRLQSSTLRFSDSSTHIKCLIGSRFHVISLGEPLPDHITAELTALGVPVFLVRHSGEWCSLRSQLFPVS